MVRVANRVLLLLIRTPLGASMRKSILVLRFSGRHSGRRYEVPVTAHRVDGEVIVLTSARWRLNFRGGQDVEFALDGQAAAKRAILVEDARTVAEIYARRIRELGWKAAQRQIGIKINVTREPTVDEMTTAVEHEHLSVVRFEPRP
jgi:hypothetical protein